MFTTLYVQLAQINTVSDWTSVIGVIFMALTWMIAVYSIIQSYRTKKKADIMDTFKEYKDDHVLEHIKVDIKIDKKANLTDVVFMQEWLVRVEKKLDTVILRK